jgi:hypothetical protein
MPKTKKEIHFRWMNVASFFICLETAAGNVFSNIVLPWYSNAFCFFESLAMIAG